MLDTVKIRIADPVIATNHRLRITAPATVPSHQQYATLDLRFDNGVVERVSRVNSWNRMFRVDSSNGYLYVTFSFARLKSDGRHNLGPISQAEARALIPVLTNHLASVGIQTDLNRAIVVRLDLFADAATIRPFEDFWPLLNLLDPFRRKRMTYNGYLSLHNKQRADVFYDKRAEIGDIGVTLPENLIRYEYRLLRRDAVASVAGITSLSRVLDRWDVLNTRFRDHIREVLFGRALPAEGGSMALDHFMKFAKKGDVLPAIGAVSIMKQYGDIKTVRAVLKERKYSTQQSYNFVKKLKRYAPDIAQAQGVSLDELKQELYTKLLEGLGGIGSRAA